MSEHAVAETHGSTSDDHGHHSHNPFHAHHFDTPKQQFDAGKFGMWLFLVQEVLFFSGLFVFYAIYRVNHPEIFKWGHQALDPFYGFVNTIVLIFSSLTMAWAVRCAQKGQQTALIINLVLTLVCAGIFLCVKYVEYSAKFEHGYLWAEEFNRRQSEQQAEADKTKSEGTMNASEHAGANSADAHAATGTTHDVHNHEDHAHGPVGPPPKNAGIFFSIYFGMTGLHAIHVIAGIVAISWILARSIRGDFGPDYFGPVDYVGLYWHLVDLVWIYLFPMLYLIE